MNKTCFINQQGDKTFMQVHIPGKLLCDVSVVALVFSWRIERVAKSCKGRSHDCCCHNSIYELLSYHIINSCAVFLASSKTSFSQIFKF